MILSEINISRTLARRYVERCCIRVEQDGKTIQAFTEFEGKMRVTDWGGTSSAIYLFQQIGTSGDIEFEKKLNQAKKWLLSNQSQEGAWEAAEMHCCEATAAVLFDLSNTSLLSKKQIEKAVTYIRSCYIQDGGYFVSRPGISQMPHLYTTYLAVRSLSIIKHQSFNSIVKNKVIQWVDNAKATDGLWGATSQTLEGDVVHTVFALLIMYYCGVDNKIINKKYHKQIKWLKNKIKDCSTINNAFTYEATEVYEDSKNDADGAGAYILKSYHFNIALMCSLFIKIGELGVSQRLIQKLLNLQAPGGGWGLRNERKEFVWATQQAIDCMQEFERALFSGKNRLISLLRSFAYSIPYFGTKLTLMFIMVPILIWLIKAGQKGPDIILSIIMMIVPWLIKKED